MRAVPEGHHERFNERYMSPALREKLLNSKKGGGERTIRSSSCRPGGLGSKASAVQERAL